MLESSVVDDELLEEVIDDVGEEELVDVDSTVAVLDELL